MLSTDEIQYLVAKRAYEISRQRRPDEGDELSDWLRAETEILASVRPASVDLAEGDASTGEPGKAKHMDESTMLGIAKQALAELELDIGIHGAAPVPGASDWCISFSTGYGQVCVTVGPDSTNNSIKEEIKHQLLNRGTS